MIALKHKQKILIIGNGAIAVERGGGKYINGHTAKLLLGLASSGFHATYLAPPVQFDQHSNLYDFNLNESVIDTVLLPSNRRSMISYLLCILRAINTTNFVYIFLPGKVGMLAGLMCRVLGRPYGVYVRGAEYDRGMLAKAVLFGARFALTVSPSIADDLQRFCADVEIIRPMVSLEESDAKKRVTLKQPPGTWNFLYVGNLSHGKGVPELVEAAKILHQKGFPFKLKMVGGGTLYDDLVRASNNGKYSGIIDVVGMISDKDTLFTAYEEADIFVFPTHNEGFPRVLYEAMIKSLPILTTMVGGIPGRMRHEDNCIEIPVNNPEGIVSAIENVTSDLDTLNGLAVRGQETVLNVLRTHRNHQDLIIEKVNSNA